MSRKSSPPNDAQERNTEIVRWHSLHNQRLIQTPTSFRAISPFGFRR